MIDAGRILKKKMRLILLEFYMFSLDALSYADCVVSRVSSITKRSKALPAETQEAHFYSGKSPYKSTTGQLCGCTLTNSSN